MRFFVLLEKEFLNIKKNRVAFMILFFVPILIILITSNAVEENTNMYSVGIVNQDGDNNLTKPLIDNLKKIEVFDIREYNNEATAKKQLENEEIVSYLVIPNGFYKNHMKGAGTLRLNIDNSKPVNASIVEGITERLVEKLNTRIQSVMTSIYVNRQIVPNTDVKMIVNYANAYLGDLNRDPIVIEKSYLLNTTSINKMTNSNQTTCGMTAMFILYLCIMWGSINIIDEKISGTMTRLRLSPAHFVTILSSKLAYTGVMAFMQFMIFFGIGYFLLNLPIGNVGLLTLVGLAFILQAAALGLLISIISKSRVVAMGLSFFVIMILSPLGGLWFPLEIVPDTMKVIASFLPTGAFMIAMETVMLKGGDFSAIVMPLIVIFVYFSIFSFVSIQMGMVKKRMC